MGVVRSYRNVLVYVSILAGSIIVVSGRDQPPYIRSDLASYDFSVSINGNARIDCWVYGSLPLNITWYKNGKLIHPGSNIEILKNHSLVIRNFQLSPTRDDGGNYYCHAENEYGKFTSQVTTINVRYLGDTFGGPKDATVFYRESYTFKCIPPNGYPKPRFVEWRKDGNKMTRTVLENDNARILPSEDGIILLQIKSAERKNAGEYSCVAKNKEGVRISPSASLRIIARDAPKIAIKSPIKVHLGGKAEIHCADISDDVGSRPAPDRSWSKIGGTLPKSRITQTDDGVLKILNVVQSDEGKYKCTASNGDLSSSAYGELQVYEPPRIVVEPTNMSIPFNSDVKFTCKVAKGINPYIYWRHGSKSYRKKVRYRRVRVTDNRLIVKNVQLDDEGTIRCLVADGGKIISSTEIKLTVLQTTHSLPQIQLNPVKQTVVAGRKHTLTCIGMGDGNLKFVWLHAATNKIVLPNEEVQIKYFPNGSSLTFNTIKPKDSGFYRCKVFGEGGTTSTLISDVKVEFGVPSKVSSFNVIEVQKNAVKLMWKKPSDKYALPITYYAIKTIKTLDDQRVETKHSMASSDLDSTLIKNLDSTASYIFSIAAVNSIGTGEYVNSEIIGMMNGGSSSLKSLSLSTASINHDRVSLKLDKILGKAISRYEFYVSWREDQHMMKKVYRVEKLKEMNEYIVKGLQPNTNYQITLKAFMSDSEVAKSSQINVKTLVKIDNFAVRKIDDENLMVLWSPPKGFDEMKDAIGYEVTCLYADSGAAFFTANVNKRAKKYLLSGLQAWTTYSISLLVKTSGGYAAGSVEIPITLDKMKENQIIGKLPDSSLIIQSSEDKEGSIARMMRQPWFIVAAAVLIWLLLMFAVICIVKACKARRKKRYERSMDFNNALLHGRMDYSSNTLQNLASWKKKGSEVEIKTCPRKKKKVKSCCHASRSTINDEFPNRADIKTRMSYTRNEAIEYRPKTNTYEIIKESNNAIAKKNGYVSDHLYNEINRNQQPCIVTNGDYPRMLLRRTSQDTSVPLPASSLPRREQRFKSDSAERRHAEILRTAGNKSFPDAKPVNVLDSNPNSSWKHISKDSPKLKKVPGEDTLRRQNKFKPLPALEVLNWANGLPTSNSSQSDSMKESFHQFSSPKASNPSDSRRSNTKMESTVVSQTPDDEKQRRRLSNASSMMSSELYQSELDPSAYSDTASERRRKKERSIPPPIGLEGLTSDILLQWAESVTNSSPSSSESSSPTRLSGMSSDGSIFTDQNFAKAVAAVAECGGFNLNHDTSTPNKFAPHLSMNNYLSGLGKLPSDMCSRVKNNNNNNKKSSSLDKNLVRYGTGFQDVDSVSSASKPLTKSNLNKHNSSLERDNKDPSLTISNLREHNTSLDRSNRRPSQKKATNNSRGRSSTVTTKPIPMPEAPLSFTSALERQDSKGSLNSSNNSLNENASGTSERKPKAERL